MRVTLDCFSDRRPNPSWVIPPTLAGRVVGWITRLPPAITESPDLRVVEGYRGFRLATNTRTVVVYAGHVWDGNYYNTLWDEGRIIERTLIETARPHLTVRHFKALAAEINGLKVPAD